MKWPERLDPNRIRLDSERIPTEDAVRQAQTASEILKRFHELPGVVLADEVGMGKTFVALAVAVSTAWAERSGRPVVVMVPPSLQRKWPRDYDVFCDLCLRNPEKHKLLAKPATRAVEFFKLLDDPARKRARIIFLTHGAFYRSLRDPWTMLAILKQALRPRRYRQKLDALPKFASKILRVETRFRGKEDLFRELIRRKSSYWKKVLNAHGVPTDDDPVPEAIARVIEKNKIDLAELREALDHLPIRRSKHLGQRIKEVRTALKTVLKWLWPEAIAATRFTSPLLILDEAHHLKNPGTRLASLFVDPEADEDISLLQGALSSRFDRMLFLTATPFQLGHYELMNVLNRFDGINWRRKHWALDRSIFHERLDALGKALDGAQRASTHLDRTWARLTPEHLKDDGHSDVDSWWAGIPANANEQSGSVGIVLRAYERAHAAMKTAESLLRPFVIRHLRSRQLPESDDLRRQLYTGAEIEGPGRTGGISIAGNAVLPFLLSARCHAAHLAEVRERGKGAGRSTFSQGLASSYEAFLETRSAAHDSTGRSPIADELPDDNLGLGSDSRVDWYLDRLHEALPDGREYASHPKIRATVARVLDYWKRNEKVLVFCHYRATGRALEGHIAAALEDEIAGRAAASLGVSTGNIQRELENIRDRFGMDRPIGRALADFVRGSLQRFSGLRGSDQEAVQRIVRRFVRTPSFLVRHFDLRRIDQIEELDRALDRTDESELSLRQKLLDFMSFLDKRCSTDAEREAYIGALESIHTREVVGGDSQDAPDAEGVARRSRIAPVRLANGEVKQETRQTLMLAFNTPFYPEILIASSVLAEGVDLHLACRHVIHHDLDWNPSTLEQRTGRVDRIDCKAERVKKPIHVFEPYVGGTQDEKVFRVVKDRARWFQVLMGENYSLDDQATDRLEERVPLPEAAAERLAFDLAVWKA